VRFDLGLSLQVISTAAILFTYFYLSYDSPAAESMGLSSLYKYGSQNGSQNESHINDFVQLSFSK
jgi:hypothetical protein